MSRRPRWDTDAGITDRDVPPCAGSASSTPPAPTSSASCSAGCRPAPSIEGQLGETTLRDVLDRWEDRGLVDRDRLLGHLWVAPTVKALRLVGLDVRAWSFVIPQLAHVHAVGVVRLALEPSIPAGGRWLSEGAAPRGRQEPCPRRRHPAPRRPGHRRRRRLYGEDVDPLPKRVAVEVELTRKGAARLRERPGPVPAMAAGPGPSTTPRPRSPAT